MEIKSPFGTPVGYETRGSGGVLLRLLLGGILCVSHDSLAAVAFNLKCIG